MAWDFTSPHPFVPSAIPLNKNVGTLPMIRTGRKCQNIALFRMDMIFAPLQSTPLERMYGSSAHSTIKEIGKRISQFSGNPESTLYLRQRISIAIQKGNSIILQFALRNTKM